MGTCLAIIKVVGTTTLGIYAGTVLTATTGHEILQYVLTSTPADSSAKSQALVRRSVAWFGGIVTALGVISSTAFQLAYSGAPKSMKHPYLIYASLVFPVSTAVWYGVAGSAVQNYVQLPTLVEKRVKSKAEKKVVSDLDNSVYKDLGETSADEAAQAEDEEIEGEVEAHLTQQTAITALEKLQLGNKIVSALSVVGFVIATVGVYGDF